MQGFGEYTFHDGGLYKGKWEQNKQNGKGKARYLCGSTYEGQWRNGKWNGKGRYIDKNRVTPVKILKNEHFFRSSALHCTAKARILIFA